jgi:hypothetical protein
MELPKYVKLGNTAMRLIEATEHTPAHYYRDGGAWSADIKIVDGKLISDHYYEHLRGIEFIPITKEEWAEDNRGYCEHLLYPDKPDKEVVELVRELRNAVENLGEYFNSSIYIDLENKTSKILEYWDD